MSQDSPDSGKAGRQLALVIAGTGVFWTLAVLLGEEYNWSQRVRGLFDLIALALFGVAFIFALRLWRTRK
jgi:hypothetical protein